MIKRNHGSTEQEILQNHFTSFITTSLRRERIAYLKAKYRRIKNECEMTDEQFIMIADETDFVSKLCDSDYIASALKQLNDKERYVLIARVIEEKDFEEIADKLGMKYKGVAAIYYRTIAKLRNFLGGEI